MNSDQTVRPDNDLPLTQAEVRSRAVAGSRVIALRGVLVRSISFVGALILARMLGPSDFGAVAVGSGVLAAGVLIADGGLGAALIRRPLAPSRVELASLQGWQLLMTLSLLAAASAIAPWFGRTGFVCLVMMFSLPVATLQIPGAITLERELQYGRRVVVELIEAGTWLTFGVVLVALGAGVWGLAGASIARSIGGATAMLLLGPIRVAPKLSWQPVRRLIRFGVKFQAVGAINLARDQGANLVALVFGGLGALGLWSLAFRVMQLPYLVLEALWRVSFPAMSRLVETGADVRPVLRKVLELTTVGNGFVLVGLGSASPRLVETLFGSQWQGAAAAIPPACAGLLIGGGTSVAAAGLLLARGLTRAILLASVLHTVAWLSAAVALWPIAGVASLGWGWLFSSVVDAAILGRALHQQTGLFAARSQWKPVVLALGCMVPGILVAQHAPSAPVGAIAGGVVGLALFAAGTAAFCRSTLQTLVRLAIHASPGHHL